ncbi:MAG: hypothetical protein ABS87_03965 [Sphingomonas sp. SCN 67-18]|uniref:hypothetical protein n=1 Tax=uncultured Sphingomonas sp. TaxID=158754 RepID=UPI00086CDCBD|nr:hypothetical protein [uncultured Sphingomonas sp.]ODU21878.1 MAG: hypothetical protein ABS87_03965 [Sphingomonas sp. SCN 67-18]
MVDDRKEILPLRIVGARFISTEEQVGLVELDRITVDASRAIQNRYWLWATSFMTMASATVGSVLIGGALTLGEAPGADIAILIGLGCAVSTMAIGASWRMFQYGGMKARSPQEPLYADPADPAVRNLERLFGILQLESSPRAFYLTRNGARRYVDHRYFFGNLRAAHIARSGTIRSALFGPVGLWFDRELFLEADVAELINQSKAKPSRAGAPKKYDYTSAIISLIEHPQVQSIDINKKKGNLTLIIGLLEKWYLGRNQRPPSETQLSGYANDILEAIKKNRSSKS